MTSTVIIIIALVMYLAVYFLYTRRINAHVKKLDKNVRNAPQSSDNRTC